MKATGKRLLALTMAALMMLAPLEMSSAGDREAQDVSRYSSECALEKHQDSAKAPKSIKITGSKYVAKGKKITLKAAVSPSGASQKVTWVSGNKKLATVSSSGVVTGKKAGTVKITAVSKANKKIKKTFTVKVTAKAVSKVTITNPVDVIDLAGETSRRITLFAKASPSKAAQSFTWTSSDKHVATVNDKGVVKAVGTGTVQITATATDGSNKKKTITIEVIDSSEKMEITKQPQDVIAMEGDKATFHVEATGSGLRYQWWYLPPNASDFIMYSGPDAQTNTITVTATQELNGYGYCCMVSTLYGSYAQSDIVYLTAVTEMNAVSQPQDVTAEDGAQVSVSFNVTGTGLTYQWYYAFPGAQDWTAYENATTDTLSFQMTEDLDGMNLFCRATDILSNYINSDVAVISLKINPEITITQQPANTWGYAGEQATFRVKATGTKLSYQWFYAFPGDAGWTKIDDAVSDTLVVNVQEKDNGLNVVCMVYNPLGNSVQSETAVLSVSVKPVFRALLIANGAYSDKPLKSTYTNAKALKYALENALRYPYQVTYYTDCSDSQILNGIRSAFAGAKDTDVSLFYFDGHGGEVTGNSSHPLSGSLSGIDKSWVSPEQLANALKSVPGKVIVILACCHSGAHIGTGVSTSGASELSDFNRAFINALKKYKLKKNGVQSNFGELRDDKFIVLTACMSYETSVSWSDGSGGSFPWALVESMGCTWPGTAYNGSSPADTDGNKLLTLGECWSYVSVRAKQIINHDQNASYYGDTSYPLFMMK